MERRFNVTGQNKQLRMDLAQSLSKVRQPLVDAVKMLGQGFHGGFGRISLVLPIFDVLQSTGSISRGYHLKKVRRLVEPVGNEVFQPPFGSSAPQLRCPFGDFVGAKWADEVRNGYFQLGV